MSVTPDILKIITEQKPKFQLSSGTSALPSSENHFYSRGPSDTAGLTRSSQEVDDPTKAYLLSEVQAGFRTLETGGGVSTLIFGARGAKHICVNPDLTANVMIAEFLRRNDIDPGNIRFVGGCSDRVLPTLDIDGELDLVLIDGNHSFPVPVVDWYYLDPHLRVGGRLLVDNTSINAVRMLCDFLLADEGYRFLTKVGDCMVYEKTAAIRKMGWADQGINRRAFFGYRPVSLSEQLRSVVRTWISSPAHRAFRKLRS